MGFGYGQARAAGLGGIRTSRSPNQVNEYIKDKKIERGAIGSLREHVADPEWEPLVKHRVVDGRSAQQIDEEIYWIKRYAWAKSKGYSLAYRLKFHWRK